MESSVTEKAYAKINLSLDIRGIAENGYHDVSMIMQTVDLWDTITLRMNREEKQTGDGIIFRQIHDNDLLPEKAADNLIYRAALKFREKYDFHEPVEITLDKQIPVAAGLAGGSSDAAATLRGLAKLSGIQPPLEELQQIGAELGSDIPFCVTGGTALAEGTGTRLTRLKNMPDCLVLLVKPAFSVSTAEAYRGYDEAVAVAGDKIRRPDTAGMLQAIETGDLKQMLQGDGNVLELWTAAQYPEILKIENQMLSGGALGAQMSGSGPTVFGIYRKEDRIQAEKTAENIRKSVKTEKIYIAHPVSGEEIIK